MAERARIAVQSGGLFHSVYVHDGYDLLPVLNGHHGNKDAALALIALGDLSQVKMFHGGSVPMPGHTFRDPKPNFTVAYHRDRGETFRQAALTNLRGLLELCSDSDADFLYIFEEGTGRWAKMVRNNW